VSDSHDGVVVSVERIDGLSFKVDFGDGWDPLLTDEPAPIGGGAGPNPSRLLAAAIGNCLAASLVFCLERAKIEVTGARAQVAVSFDRNEKGRLRVSAAQVELSVEVAEPNPGRLERCLSIFQDFCVVTESVRHGIPVEVKVRNKETMAKLTETQGPLESR